MSHKPSTPARKTVAYVMSRFPKVSETFILYEILELERQGLRVEIFPLVRQREQVMHPEAEALVRRTHYTRLLSLAVLLAQLYWLLRRPGAYLGAWLDAVRGNWRSGKFLLRALAVVPQAALFARMMQRLGVEHVHAHWATHPALAAYVVRRLTGLPYSFTAHAHDIYVERHMLREKIGAASFVATISEYNRTLLRKLYGGIADNVVVVHCGVDLSVFRPQPQVAQSQPFTIVCVASLEEKKGHPYLIDACAQLVAQGIDLRCLLVGEGDDRPAIEAQIARLNLGGRVTLLGHQPRHRVSELLAGADAVVLPSIVTEHGKQEGIPVALMEALATERAVVATEISGVPELVVNEQTGLLVPQRDAAAIARALLRLAGDAELRLRLGAAGRVKVLQEFDLQNTCARLRTLLSQDWSKTGARAADVLPMLTPDS